MLRENCYRTLYCGDLRESHIGQTVRVAGWLENNRDHGGVMFLDIRDQYGVVQVVIHDENMLKGLNKECSLTVSGSCFSQMNLSDNDTSFKMFSFSIPDGI